MSPESKRKTATFPPGKYSFSRSPSFYFSLKLDECIVKMQFMLRNCDACITLFIYFDRNDLAKVLLENYRASLQHRSITFVLEVYITTCYHLTHRCFCLNPYERIVVDNFFECLSFVL